MANESVEPRADNQTKDHRENQKANRIALYLMCATIAFSVCAEILHHFGSSILAGAALIVALCFSSYNIRRRSCPINSNIIAISAACFTVQFIFIAGAVYNLLFAGPYIATDAVKMILSLALGLIGLGVALCVGATYLPKWPYTEALALAIIALTMGALCLPGLRVFTRPLGYPSTNGIGLLFATGSPSQKVSLQVKLIGLNIPASFHETTSEEFDISTTSKSAVHWALLVAGDAQMITGSMGWDSSHDIAFHAFNGETSDGDYAGPLQLITGTVTSKASTWVDGDVEADFVNRATDHSTALLPDYGQGYAGADCPGGRSDTDDCLSGLTSGATENIVIRALQGRPVSRELKEFPVSVQGGIFWSNDTIVDSQPSASPAPPNDVLWSGTGNLQVSYSTAAKTANDDTTGILFVFAILFGVAGAGLLGAIQITIHVIASPESNKKNSPPKESD
jgi:hypothetical protein